MPSECRERHFMTYLMRGPGRTLKKWNILRAICLSKPAVSCILLSSLGHTSLLGGSALFGIQLRGGRDGDTFGLCSVGSEWFTVTFTYISVVAYISISFPLEHSTANIWVAQKKHILKCVVDWSSPNSYNEVLIPHVMVCGYGDFGWWLNLEDAWGTLMMLLLPL